MFDKRYVFLGAISLALLLAALANSAPVLIEVDLESKSDFEYAQNLNLSPWARWGNIFLAEADQEILSLLKQAGIEYDLITSSPRAFENYLVAPRPGAGLSLVTQVLGKPVLNRTEQRLVQLTATQVDKIRSQGFTVLEIGQEPIPFTYVTKLEVRQPAGIVADWIQTLVDQVSQDSLQAYNLRLQNFQTRYSYSDSIASAREWIMDKFASFGIDSLYLDHFFWDSDQWNVVATVPGTAEPDALIIVGGHYDSVTYNQSPGPATYAPGADDNGSGTAATLELARIIAQNPLPQTVVFVPFAQEEQGLRGSSAYAAEAFAEGKDIRFMLNMDMIGYKPNTTNVNLLHDPPSVAVADLMVSLATTYAGLTGIKGSASGNSDHWHFMQKGWRAVFAHEYVFNSQGWHKNTDIVDSMDFDYMTKVVKLALATVASLSQNSCQAYAGDTNQDGSITLEDAIYLVRHLFGGGETFNIDPQCKGDVNASGNLTLGDAIRLANFIFGKPGDWTPIATGSCCSL